MRKAICSWITPDNINIFEKISLEHFKLILVPESEQSVPPKYQSKPPKVYTFFSNLKYSKHETLHVHM